MKKVIYDWFFFPSGMYDVIFILALSKIKLLLYSIVSSMEAFVTIEIHKKNQLISLLKWVQESEKLDGRSV